ncbi:hypothetical protein MuYL_1628 [Mucilaginibacter xinganensis]|uniref:Uncharacterized protein n=1 Tax=Mucilaginibacter xinganensis TaxID=1234841 RepID=A0A223NUL5_9SPHI|nr:hypothetical protein MuYL_1628 [Mucilaginibacter xinganensis]
MQSATGTFLSINNTIHLPEFKVNHINKCTSIRNKPAIY